MSNLCYNNSFIVGAMLFNIALSNGTVSYSNNSTTQAPNFVIEKYVHENTDSITNISSTKFEQTYSESRKGEYSMKYTKRDTSTYENIPSVCIKKILELEYYEENEVESLHVLPRRTIDLAGDIVEVKRAKVSLVDSEENQVIEFEKINVKPRRIIKL